MCGRFTLIINLSTIVKSFHIQEVVYEYRSSNNISPGESFGFAGLYETWMSPLQNYNGHFRGNQQQDKTPVPDGVWLKERLLFPAQNPSALWTTQPKAFNLNTKEGKIQGSAGAHI